MNETKPVEIEVTNYAYLPLRPTSYWVREKKMLYLWQSGSPSSACQHKITAIKNKGRVKYICLECGKKFVLRSGFLEEAGQTRPDALRSRQCQISHIETHIRLCPYPENSPDPSSVA